MTSVYLFRLYASPWKLGFLMAALVAFAALCYQALFQPGAHPDAWFTFLDWVGLVSFGFSALLFGALFLIFVVARRPLLEITAEGWRLIPFPFIWQVTNIAWRDLARMGIYKQSGGRSVMYYLVLMPRTPELLEEQELGDLARFYPTWFSSPAQRLLLNFAFLRATPTKCERLLNDIKTVSASEITQYDVYVEPQIQRM